MPMRCQSQTRLPRSCHCERSRSVRQKGWMHSNDWKSPQAGESFDVRRFCTAITGKATKAGGDSLLLLGGFWNEENTARAHQNNSQGFGGAPCEIPARLAARDIQ